MSSEATPSSLLQDSDSYDIATASSVLSSTTSSVSPQHETLASLLLQIQQYHSSKLQKLQEKVNRWKTKCDKLAKISNENARVAKIYKKENQLLKTQVVELRQQLYSLENPRRNDPQNASLPPEVLPNKEMGLLQGQNEALVKQMSKTTKRLASKRSSKKVRYSEIAPNNSCLKQPACKQRKSDPLPNSEVKPVVNLSLLSGSKNKLTSPSAEILVPNTCLSPVIESLPPRAGEVMPGRGNAMGTGGGHRPRILKNVSTVPETLDVKHNNPDLELSDEGCIEEPTYASTPIGGRSQTPFSESEQILSRSPAITSDGTKVVRKTDDTLCGRKVLTTPLPKSESQFPVDLNRTQNRSPTFCGEGTTTPISTCGTSRLLATHNADRNKPSPCRGTPSDVCPKDESYESDASIQLLGSNIPRNSSPQRHCFFTSRSGLGLSEGTQENVYLQDKATRLPDTKYKSPDLVLRPNSNLLKEHPSKKRKIDLDVEPNSFDETALPDGESPGKENSPEDIYNLGMSSSLKSRNQCKVEQHAEAGRGKGNKLKQSKLTSEMFQGSTNKSASLMREYNGGSLVNVNSQQDTYMNLALEKSLLDQKASGSVKRDGMSTDLELVSRGFKVPNLPQKRRLHSTSEGKSRTKGSPSRAQGRTPYNSQGKYSDLPYDLNGSIDPLLDLTRLENGNTSTSEHLNHGGEHLQKTEEDSCLDLFQEEKETDDEVEKFDESTSQESNESMTSFDQLPKMNNKPSYKYTEVVRKQRDRQKLKGFGCKECEMFYKDLPLTDSQREDRMKMCSRHRAQFSPPHTPEHYWSIGFPDTQTCLQRGYLRDSNSPELGRRKSKKNKYKMLFSGKEEDALAERDVE